MKNYLFFTLIIASINVLYSQEGDLFDQFLDELLEENLLNIENDLKQSNSRFFYLSTTYNNQTYFYGRNNLINQYGISPNLSFFLSNGFSLTYFGNFLSESNPVWNNHNLTISYTKKFDKIPFGIMGSISRSFYMEPEVQNSNILSFLLFTNNSKNTFGSSIYYSKGGNSLSFDQLVITSFLKINLLKRKWNFDIRPEINLLFGDNVSFFISESFRGLRRNLEENFSILNTQLSLPLNFYNKKISFTIEYNLNFPNLLGEENTITNNSFIGINIGYFLPF